MFCVLFIYLFCPCCVFRTSSLLPTLTMFCPGLTPGPACLTKWSTLSSGGGGRSRSRGSLCSTAMSCSVKRNKNSRARLWHSHWFKVFLSFICGWFLIWSETLVITFKRFAEVSVNVGHSYFVWRPQKNYWNWSSISRSSHQVFFFFLRGQQLVVLIVNLEKRINS